LSICRLQIGADLAIETSRVFAILSSLPRDDRSTRTAFLSLFIRETTARCLEMTCFVRKLGPTSNHTRGVIDGSSLQFGNVTFEFRGSDTPSIFDRERLLALISQKISGTRFRDLKVKILVS